MAELSEETALRFGAALVDAAAKQGFDISITESSESEVVAHSAEGEDLAGCGIFIIIDGS